MINCISRCVRRAFLCGLDPFTNRSYEHRRDLIEKGLLKLTDIFCIDFCAYVVMSNHYHCVLHINQLKPLNLSLDEIIERLCPWMDGSKAMHMDQKLSPILQRLGLSTEQWSQACKGFESEFSIFVGGAAAIEKACKVFSKQWVNLQSHRLRLLAD